jgi:hypothetical protein
MPPAIKVAIPPGKIGVSFKNTDPPAVSGVSDQSPLKGRVKPGYLFDTLYLADGTEFTRLTSKELIQTLADYDEEEGRKIKFRLALPKSIKVTIPPGEAGITVEGNPPLITSIARTSPLNDLFDEVAKMPDEIEVVLPADRLGITFQGSPPVISKVAKDSPVEDEFVIGLAVDTVTLADGSIHTELATSTLVKMLRDTAEMEGRKVVLKNPATMKFTRKPAVVEASRPQGKLGESESSLQT